MEKPAVNEARYLDTSAMGQLVYECFESWGLPLAFSTGTELFFANSVCSMLNTIIGQTAGFTNVRCIHIVNCNHPVVNELCSELAQILGLEVHLSTDNKGSISEYVLASNRETVSGDILVVPSCHWLTGELVDDDVIDKLGNADCFTILDSAQQFGASLFTNDLVSRPKLFAELFSLSKFAGSAKPRSFALCDSKKVGELLGLSLATNDPFGRFFPRESEGRRWLDHTKDGSGAREAMRIFEQFALDKTVASRRAILAENQKAIASAVEGIHARFLLEPSEFFRSNRAVVAFEMPNALAEPISQNLKESGFQHSCYRDLLTTGTSCFRLSCPTVLLTESDQDDLRFCLNGRREGNR